MRGIRGIERLWRPFERFKDGKRVMVTAVILTFLQALPVTFARTADLNAPVENVNWISLDDAIDYARSQDKKILIEIYTEWCGWCRLMHKKTYGNPKVATYMNKKYCAVRLDAGYKKDIWFRGYRFRYLPEFHIHQLAYQLLEGHLRYPTAVILNKDVEVLTPIKGFVEADEMEKILRFYGDDAYQKQKWTEYRKNYQPPAPETEKK